MHVELHSRFADSEQGQKAQALTAACVHCGFCLPTCPTYADSRDERDSPRGRIYLIKALLESGSADDPTRLHLDRCLTCRNCETACPSGMQYGELLDIGRDLVEQHAPRPFAEKMERRLLRFILLKPLLLNTGLRMAQALRPLLPGKLRRKIPVRQRQRHRSLATQQQPRTMLILEGCVQKAAAPNTNAAARQVLNSLGISLISVPRAGCCGALNYHLAAHRDGLNDMRRNIDAWWPSVQDGAEAIVSSASGCGAMLVDYGRLLADDPAYAEKARHISALTRDLGEILLDEDLDKLSLNTRIGKVAVHTPCTLQHALQQPELITTVLANLGFDLAHLSERLGCCGSAGTYSLLQPEISGRLLDTSLTTLTADQPAIIATANIGCQLQLQSASKVPVVHWVELVADALPLQVLQQTTQ